MGNFLDIKNIRDIVSKLDDQCKIKTNAGTTGGLQEQWFLTEDGLYKVIIRSRKPIVQILDF